MAALNRAEPLSRETPAKRSASNGGTRRQAGGGRPSQAGTGAAFSAKELGALEEAHPDGLQASAVVELLQDRGVHISEATFRKYVQLGLLPRSRRVGRKGKHRGSHGLYPVDCVSRIVEIKALMESGLTLEEIQRSALTVGAEVDVLRRTAEGIVQRLELALEEGEPAGAGRVASMRRKNLASSLTQLRDLAGELVRAMEDATLAICAPGSGPVGGGLDGVEQAAPTPRKGPRASTERAQAGKRQARGAEGSAPGKTKAPAGGKNKTRSGGRSGRGTAERHEEHFE